MVVPPGAYTPLIAPAPLLWATFRDGFWDRRKHAVRLKRPDPAVLSEPATLSAESAFEPALHGWGAKSPFRSFKTLVPDVIRVRRVSYMHQLTWVTDSAGRAHIVG